MIDESTLSPLTRDVCRRLDADDRHLAGLPAAGDMPPRSAQALLAFADEVFRSDREKYECVRRLVDAVEQVKGELAAMLPDDSSARARLNRGHAALDGLVMLLGAQGPAPWYVEQARGRLKQAEMRLFRGRP